MVVYMSVNSALSVLCFTSSRVFPVRPLNFTHGRNQFCQAKLFDDVIQELRLFTDPLITSHPCPKP